MPPAADSGPAMATSSPPRQELLWRLLLMLPVPYLCWLPFRAGGSIKLDGEDLALVSAQSLVSVTHAGILAAVVVGFAAAVWAPRLGLRIAGYTGYSLALGVGFATGGLLTVVNQFGGLAGEPAGTLPVSVGLGAGALCCALALMPLAALLVADLRRSRRSQDER